MYPTSTQPQPQTQPRSTSNPRSYVAPDPSALIGGAPGESNPYAQYQHGGYGGLGDTGYGYASGGMSSLSAAYNAASSSPASAAAQPSSSRRTSGPGQKLTTPPTQHAPGAPGSAGGGDPSTPYRYHTAHTPDSAHQHGGHGHGGHGHGQSPYQPSSAPPQMMSHPGMGGQQPATATAYAPYYYDQQQGLASASPITSTSAGAGGWGGYPSSAPHSYAAPQPHHSQHQRGGSHTSPAIPQGPTMGDRPGTAASGPAAGPGASPSLPSMDWGGAKAYSGWGGEAQRAPGSSSGAAPGSGAGVGAGGLSPQLQQGAWQQPPPQPQTARVAPQPSTPQSQHQHQPHQHQQGQQGQQGQSPMLQQGGWGYGHPAPQHYAAGGYPQAPGQGQGQGGQPGQGGQYGWPPQQQQQQQQQQWQGYYQPPPPPHGQHPQRPQHHSQHPHQQPHHSQHSQPHHPHSHQQQQPQPIVLPPVSTTALPPPPPAAIAAPAAPAAPAAKKRVRKKVKVEVPEVVDTLPGVAVSGVPGMPGVQGVLGAPGMPGIPGVPGVPGDLNLGPALGGSVLPPEYAGLGKRPAESGGEEESGGEHGELAGEKKGGKKRKAKGDDAHGHATAAGDGVGADGGEPPKPAHVVKAKSHLHPPKQAQSAWQLFFTDELNKAKALDAEAAATAASTTSPGGTVSAPPPKLNVAQIAKDAGHLYAALSEERKAYYAQKVQESKEQYARDLAAWQLTLTPEDIRAENAFRAQQRKEGKSRKGNIKDPNAPKKPLSAYFLFLKGIRENEDIREQIWGGETETTKQSVLAAKKWRNLSMEEKKPFLVQAEHDKAGYEEARKRYEDDAAARARGEDVPTRPPEKIVSSPPRPPASILRKTPEPAGQGEGAVKSEGGEVKSDPAGEPAADGRGEGGVEPLTTTAPAEPPAPASGTSPAAPAPTSTTNPPGTSPSAAALPSSEFADPSAGLEMDEFSGFADPLDMDLSGLGGIDGIDGLDGMEGIEGMEGMGGENEQQWDELQKLMGSGDDVFGVDANAGVVDIAGAGTGVGDVNAVDIPAEVKHELDLGLTDVPVPNTNPDLPEATSEPTPVDPVNPLERLPLPAGTAPSPAGVENAEISVAPTLEEAKEEAVEGRVEGAVAEVPEVAEVVGEGEAVAEVTGEAVAEAGVEVGAEGTQGVPGAGPVVDGV
ncbi:hypothetical protein IAT38_004703 [Cryptococcus sp. DSM 104549]